jgi:hypothetical protein
MATAGYVVGRPGLWDLGLEVQAMSDFETTASSISDRVIAEQGDGYSLDPVTIITLVTSILPGILKCWQHRDEVPAAAASDRIRRMHKRNPERLRTKLARAVNFGAQQQGHRLTVDQCEAIADGMIAEAIGTTDEVVYGLCKASL